MRCRKIKDVCKIAVFILIGIIFFDILQAVLLEKSSYGKWRNYNEQENVDILILGNSHADGGIGPYHMAENFRETYGEDIDIFNYALFGMRMEQMYYFTADLLKVHTPKLIILETYAFCPLADEHREILARRAFDALPLSRNKIEGIHYCVLEDEWSYYIPLIKYHSRWKEISSDDIRMVFDSRTWSSYGTGTENEFVNPEECQNPQDDWFLQDTSQIREVRELTVSEKECLEKLLALLEEKDIHLLFVSVPYKEQMGLNSVEQIKINNYLEEEYVDNGMIQMLDMNRMWQDLEIDYGDLSNEGHLNGRGAEKTTDCLVQYLKNHYDIAAMAE